jgi:pimeloyl-ACP methyl ester carboxylesterase
VHRRATGVGELLLVDVFGGVVGKRRCRDNAALSRQVNHLATFSKEDIHEYERVYAMPGGMRGMLGYYRAVLTDMKQNKELMANKLKTPILTLGGDVGSPPDLFESVKPLGHDVRGGVIKDIGHYIPEQQPEALASEIVKFVEALPQ